MTCRKVAEYNGRAGKQKLIGVSGSQSFFAPFATEAECNQACKEGACCQGTSCTVKPACQCKCTTGRCCGPDTSNYYGVIGPTCRGGTKAECDARGGAWTDCAGCTADAANPSLSICQSTDTIPQPPVFKGVGTTCSPNPCSGVDPCATGICSSFPTQAKIEVSFTGFNSIPDATLNFYEYARQGSRPVFQSFDANLAFFSGVGWVESTPFPESEDSLLMGGVGSYYVSCQSAAASFTGGGFFINLGPISTNTGARWMPSLPTYSFAAAAWNAWIADAAAASKKPSQICRNICGTFRVTKKEYVFVGNYDQEVEAGEWIMDMTLSGCGGNPLP